MKSSTVLCYNFNKLTYLSTTGLQQHLLPSITVFVIISKAYTVVKQLNIKQQFGLALYTDNKCREGKPSPYVISHVFVF